MPTTAVHYSKQSQLPLANDSGSPIYTRPMSACPHCHKRCIIVVRRSIRMNIQVLRDRICTGCGYGFTTQMGLLDHCEACGEFDSYECKRTERVAKSPRASEGIFRVYRCKCCGHRTLTMETFPVLGQEERLKKIAVLAERDRISNS